jgi:hypothetical protein
MNAGKNMCFANSLQSRACVRASQELAIRYELFIVEDLMVTDEEQQSKHCSSAWLIAFTFICTLISYVIQKAYTIDNTV